MYVGKHFALNIGYDISSDLPYGFTLALGHRDGQPGECRYRLVISCHFDKLRIIYRDTDWVVSDEEGYIKGMPVRRQGIAASAWTGRRFTVRSIDWPKCGYVGRYA